MPNVIFFYVSFMGTQVTIHCKSCCKGAVIRLYAGTLYCSSKHAIFFKVSFPAIRFACGDIKIMSNRGICQKFAKKKSPCL